MAHLTHKQPNRCSSPPPMRQKSICQHGKSNNQCAIDLQSQNVMTSRRVWTSVGATSSPHMCIHTHTRLLHLWPHSQSIDQTNRQSVDQSVMQRSSPSVSQSVSQSWRQVAHQSIRQSVSQWGSPSAISQSVMHEGRWLISRSDRQSFSQLDRHSKTQFSIYANSVTTTGVSQYHRTWEHNRWKWIHNTSDAHKRPLHDQPVITESYGLEKDSNLHRGDATSSIPCAHIRRLLSSY